MDRLTAYYQTAAETVGNAGWAYCVQGTPGSAYGDRCDSGGLPHARRGVCLPTLARSVRREFRGTRVAPLVARLTDALRPSQAGDGYEACL